MAHGVKPIIMVARSFERRRYYEVIGTMQDSHMLIVVLIVLVTPFLPQILKGKCPSCKKRKLETLELADTAGKAQNPYVAYFVCTACRSKFRREKSAPMEPMPDEEAVGVS
jgi:hypothetical protein